MVLRPGEAITWRWGHADPVKYHGGTKPRYPDTFCNGLWEYQPNFARDLWKKGAATIAGIRRLDGRALSWGIEKMVSTETQRVGVATQKFMIDITP
jgi:hypothetical protein